MLFSYNYGLPIISEILNQSHINYPILEGRLIIIYIFMKSKTSYLAFILSLLFSLATSSPVPVSWESISEFQTSRVIIDSKAQSKFNLATIRDAQLSIPFSRTFRTIPKVALATISFQSKHFGGQQIYGGMGWLAKVQKISKNIIKLSLLTSQSFHWTKVSLNYMGMEQDFSNFLYCSNGIEIQMNSDAQNSGIKIKRQERQNNFIDQFQIIRDVQKWPSYLNKKQLDNIKLNEQGDERLIIYFNGLMISPHQLQTYSNITIDLEGVRNNQAISIKLRIISNSKFDFQGSITSLSYIRFNKRQLLLQNYFLETYNFHQNQMPHQIEEAHYRQNKFWGVNSFGIEQKCQQNSMASQDKCEDNKFKYVEIEMKKWNCKVGYNYVDLQTQQCVQECQEQKLSQSINDKNKQCFQIQRQQFNKNSLVSRQLLEFEEQNPSWKAVDCPANSHATKCYKRGNTISVSECAVGYYKASDTASSCTICPSSPHCKSCQRDWTAIKCTACQDGYYLSSNSCVACPYGCIKCVQITFFPSKKPTCSSCTGNLVLTGNPQTCGCQTNQYLSPTISFSCVNCPNGCTGCKISSNIVSCTSCNFFGFFLQGSSCTSCMPVCSTCASATTCSACPDGLTKNAASVCTCPSGTFFDKNSSKCLSGSSFQSNCVGYGYNSTFTPSDPPTVICTIPATGFYIVGGSTVACIPFCTNCTDSITCGGQCLSSFINTTNGCVCDSSNPIYPLFFDSTTKSCVSCDTLLPNCLSCANSTGTLLCSTCNSTGSFPSTSYPTISCQACDVKCGVCNNLTDCFSCLNGMVEDSGNCICNGTDLYNPLSNSCQSCPDIIYKCDTCVSGIPITCSDCSTGFYPTVSGCIACPPTCSDCNDATTCTSYELGYFLNSTTNTVSCLQCADCNTAGVEGCSSCSIPTPTGCLTCDIGYFGPDASNNCTACPLSCAKCTSNTSCSSCNSPFVFDISTGSCLCSIAEGKYLSLDSSTCDYCEIVITDCQICLAGTPTNCSQCKSGYYFQASTQACTKCDSPCSECSGNSTSCTTCLPTYKDISAGVCACDNGAQSFYDKSIIGCSSCSKLFPNCDTCEPVVSFPDQTKCSSCSIGYYWEGAICSSCPSSCSACTSLVDCSGCVSPFVPDPSSPTQCVCNSNDGQFLDPNTNSCRSCSNMISSCQTCDSTTTVFCLACGDGTYLQNGICTACSLYCATCSNGTACLTCPQGYTSSGGKCICSTSCQQCNSLSPYCTTCNPTGSSLNVCVTCAPGFYLLSGSCLNCPSTCVTCYGSGDCLTCQPKYSLISGMCSCDTGAGYYPYNNACSLCPDIIYNCDVCLESEGATQCATCADGTYMSGNTCQPCNKVCATCTSSTTCKKCASGLIYNSLTKLCECSDICATCNSNSPGCSACIYTVTQAFGQCGTCQPGYYLVSTSTPASCKQCPPSCVTCDSNADCLSCLATFQTIDGTCLCDTSSGMFLNSVSNQCVSCTSLNSLCKLCSYNSTFSTNISCIWCTQGYYIQNNTCLLTVCGDSKITQTQQCDDGNSKNLDGCSSYCLIQSGYICESGTPSLCAINSKFKISLSSIIVNSNQCNLISISFSLSQIDPQYQFANFGDMLTYYTLGYLIRRGWSYNSGIVTYDFDYTNTIQNLSVKFVFNPHLLAINSTSNIPIIFATCTIEPNNNILALYYSSEVCSTKNTTKSLTKTIEYASYGVMILSALPCKIVGLELFGVLQLSFLSIGSMDNLNTLLAPLSRMKGVQGLNIRLDNNQQEKKRLLQSISTPLTPDRVQTIGYASNFLRNCNLMFLLVCAVIVISFILYLLTYICKNCAPTLHKIAKRLIKQVLLTLILFNCFNFAYSAGLHFHYATKADPLYLLGTIAAAATMIIPLLMAMALTLTEDDGFGEFKDKFKNGIVQKSYFVVTIAYRMGLGYYMATMNQEELSTLIVLAFSIFFLLYNLVNLPFQRAYHNYRANICHFTQFVCLFVTLYYRSMKSTSNVVVVSEIFTPVYIELACILISLVVSFIVLCYEIYLFIVECFKKKTIAVANTEIEENANYEQKKNQSVVHLHENTKEQLNFYDEYS